MGNILRGSWDDHPKAKIRLLRRAAEGPVISDWNDDFVRDLLRRRLLQRKVRRGQIVLVITDAGRDALAGEGQS